MGMKPRLASTRNKRIDPKTVTAPNTHPGEEEYTRLDPFTVTEKRNIDNQGIPGVVSAPKKY